MTDPQPPQPRVFASPRVFADSVLAYAEAGWPAIKLPSGHTTFVSPEDFDRVKDHPWRVSDNGYVRATVGPIGNRRRIGLHQYIMGEPPGLEIDHKNHDPLDNRRENLRVCTPEQNHGNKRTPKNNTSGYKGVSWNKQRRKFVAQIQTKKTGIRFLGRFDDAWEAAQAYNKAATDIYGEFAYLNEKKAA